MSAVTTQSESALADILSTSLYPGAKATSIQMVLSYCKAAGLDPLQKPVHIVPMFDYKSGGMRDVVMPGIGLYRTQAARNGCAGISEPEFGPDVTESIGGMEVTFPRWCKVTAKRRLASGELVEFTATEFWKENYAVKGGKEKSISPNAMWAKRPYGQLAKCAEAQALRKAFPELGSMATAEEMEGKSIHMDDAPAQQQDLALQAFEDEHLDSMRAASLNGLDALQTAFQAIPKSPSKTAFWTKHQKALKDAAAKATVIDQTTGEVN